MCMIVLSGVSKQYSGNSPVLNAINLTVEKGSIVSVLGSSGAGKTTLIRCINGLTPCTAGTIRIDGMELPTAGTAASKKQLRSIRKKIGMIFQHYNLVEQLTVLENVLHGCLGSLPWYRSIPGLYTAAQKEAAYTIIEDIGLQELIYQRCSNLSGGQKQRVGIARALMQQPKILLCDEPVSALDPQTAEDILTYLHKTIRKYALTCIMNLHHVDYAKTYSDRIIGLHGGTLLFDGTPAALSDAVLNRLFSQENAQTAAV